MATVNLQGVRNYNNGLYIVNSIFNFNISNIKFRKKYGFNRKYLISVIGECYYFLRPFKLEENNYDILNFLSQLTISTIKWAKK